MPGDSERAGGERERCGVSLVDIGAPPSTTKVQVKAVVLSLRDIVQAFRIADPKLRADAYAERGVRVTSEPEVRLMVAQVQPTVACGRERVGGGT